MPNPEEAHFRRGAAFTFDAPAFLLLVQTLHSPLTETTPVVMAPSFDHAVKDPKPDDITIYPSNRIIVFEGNYLALNKPVWRDAAALMDELWFVEVDFEVARQRLVRRHIAAGIAENEEAADRRVRESDLLNGREIVENKLDVNEIVISKEDDAWIHG
jgi:pantothenate kinase